MAINFRGVSRKLIRTWQTRFPLFLDIKFDVKDLVSKILRKPFTNDFRALKYLSIIKGECIIDVGGNRGQSIRAIKIFHPEVKIHSFEPNSFLAEKLIRKYRSDQDVEIHSFGLGHEEFEGPLYIPFYRNWMFDGLASFDYESAASWLNPNTISGFDKALLHISEKICKIKKLDDFNFSPVFIKIDVQGLEEKVLCGGLSTLQRHRPLLLIEDAHHLIEMLSDLGYQEFHFDGSGFIKPLRRTTNSFFATSDMLARLQAGGLAVRP